MRRVVITGMASVCSLGTDHNKVFERLCKREKVTAPIEKNNDVLKKIHSSFYTPIAQVDETKYTNQLLQIKKRGSLLSYYSAYCALDAVRDAGIEKLDEDTAVIIGASSPLLDSAVEKCVIFQKTGKAGLMNIPTLMFNSTASWISVILGIHGRSCVISSACASGTESIGRAFEDIRSGKYTMSLCGGADYMRDKLWVSLKSFENLKVVSTESDSSSYPFSEERSGFLYSEGGAGMLVIEELDHALSRGARIYAEITGFEANCDGYSILSMPENGQNIEMMLRKLVGDKKVDYYNSHGTGTKLNDMVESNVLRNIFGGRDSQPAINSTKAFLGHTVSASGALEAIVCAHSIIENKVHGNVCRTILDDLNYTEETRNVSVDRAVSASFGFGGHNAALLIERYR